MTGVNPWFCPHLPSLAPLSTLLHDGGPCWSMCLPLPANQKSNHLFNIWSRRQEQNPHGETLYKSPHQHWSPVTNSKEYVEIRTGFWSSRSHCKYSTVTVHGWSRHAKDPIIGAVVFRQIFNQSLQAKSNWISGRCKFWYCFLLDTNPQPSP